MPLDTKHYDFREEAERIESELEETAEELAPLGEDNPMAPVLAQHGTQLQSQLDGLRWALRTWDVDGVTLAGLSGGEYGHVEDEMGDAGQGKARVYFVAKGSAEAPYIEDGMTFEERVAAVADLPVGYLRWADARINDLMSVEGNGGKRFNELLVEARQKTTSTDD